MVLLIAVNDWRQTRRFKWLFQFMFLPFFFSLFFLFVNFRFIFILFLYLYFPLHFYIFYLTSSKRIYNLLEKTRPEHQAYKCFVTQSIVGSAAKWSDIIYEVRLIFLAPSNVFTTLVVSLIPETTFEDFTESNGYTLSLEKDGLTEQVNSIMWIWWKLIPMRNYTASARRHSNFID